MNEQQNLALIQKIFEAFGRGDIQDMLDCFAADSEVYYPGPAIIPYAGKKKGHAELRDYFQGILENQSNHDLKISRFITQDDHVVAIGSYSGVVNSTGKTIEGPLVFTFELHNGTVTRHMLMSDTAAGAAGYSTAT